VEECGPCPIFASFTLAFVLQLRKKHGKPSVRVRKTSVRLRKTSVRLRKTSVIVHYTYYQKHPHITKPFQTHTFLRERDPGTTGGPNIRPGRFDSKEFLANNGI
jgi:hypothetical protein